MFEEFKEAMTKEFGMTNIGLMSYYLGIEVKQNDEGIFISQKGMQMKFSTNSILEIAKPVSTLIECGIKISKHADGEIVNPTFIKSIVESLRYLTCTRLNILYAISLVSRYIESPTAAYLKIAKRILRYIKGTLDFGIFYSSFTIASWLDTMMVTG